jgi:hypothetical protein
VRARIADGDVRERAEDEDPRRRRIRVRVAVLLLEIEACELAGRLVVADDDASIDTEIPSAGSWRRSLHVWMNVAGSPQTDSSAVVKPKTWSLHRVRRIDRVEVGYLRRRP